MNKKVMSLDILSFLLSFFFDNLITKERFELNTCLLEI